MQDSPAECGTVGKYDVHIGVCMCVCVSICVHLQAGVSLCSGIARVVCRCDHTGQYTLSGGSRKLERGVQWEIARVARASFYESRAHLR